MTDHIEKARELLNAEPPSPGTIGLTDFVFINAWRGIGHALLAIHDQMQPPAVQVVHFPEDLDLSDERVGRTVQEALSQIAEIGRGKK